MHRRGHVGMALLAYAPVGFLFLQDRQIGLALLGLIGVLTVEPLPDSDFWLPGLRHRGTSHSILCALVVGAVIGALGWFIGNQVVVVFANVLADLDTTTVGIFAGLFQWTAEQLRRLDGRTLAGFGFAVGVFGIVVHLLADAITVAGIRPLLPLSRWRLSLSSIRSDSPVANTGLLALGVLVIAAVFLVTAPGIGIAGVPADLSPVDVAAGQSQNQTNATVEVANQTSNGSTVTIERATLPEGGFIAIHESAYINGPAAADSSIIAVSERLDAGTHRNVTVEISNAPTANFPGMNRSRLNASQTIAAVAYQDTNGNQRFDFVRSVGSTDGAYTTGGSEVSDTAGITVPRSEQPRPTASVTFTDQQIQNGTLVVEQVRLPQGGFLVAHNESYQRTGDPMTSAVGLSGYLPQGRHRNITLDVLPSALNRSQTVTVRPAMDTNDNQRYDYVRSNGFQDVAYSTRNQSSTVAASAQVSDPGTSNATPTASPTASATATPTATSTATSTASSTVTPVGTTTGGSAANQSGDSAGDNLPVFAIIGALITLILAVIAVRRVS